MEYLGNWGMAALINTSKVLQDLYFCSLGLFPFQTHLRLMHNLCLLITHAFQTIFKKKMIIIKKTFLNVWMNIHFPSSFLTCLLILITHAWNLAQAWVLVFGFLVAESFHHFVCSRTSFPQCRTLGCTSPIQQLLAWAIASMANL
jgi:hypothetical protein